MEDFEGQKKDVFIITGFLGAGKTTTLNHLLQKFSPETTVIIENEFGKVNIDTSLINQAYKKVFELTNGCICCSLDEDLYDVLTEIALERTEIKHVFIETTGIADAGNIAAIFKRTEVQQLFQLQTIICVVDVETIEDYLENTLETQRQLIASDVILLNKHHLVSEVYSIRMEGMLKEINPFARVVRLIDDILPMKRSKTEERSSVSYSSIPQASSGKSSHRINSVLYESDVVFDFQHLCYTLNTTLFFYYHQVFRIKGFVKCINHAEATPSVNIYEVQSTGKSLHVTISEKKDFMLNQLVFIGRQLKTDTITRLLR